MTEYFVSALQMERSASLMQIFTTNTSSFQVRQQ